MFFEMIREGFIFCVMICATYVIATPQGARFKPWYASRFYRPRQRRSSLDTQFMDIARKAFTSLATDQGLKPNNKFHQAIDEIEKALASMQAQKGVLRQFKEDAAEEFMKILEHSAKSGNIETFREVLGRAIFHNMTQLSLATASKQSTKKPGLPSDNRKALLDGAKVFLSDIKQQIGEEHFEELISIHGEVIA